MSICSDEAFAHCMTVTTRISLSPLYEGLTEKLIDVFKTDKLWNSGTDCRPIGYFGTGNL